MTRSPNAALLALLALAPLATWAALAFGHDPVAHEASAELRTRDAGYRGATACRACHPDQYESWSRTYHATMTQLPARASVLGRFDGRPVELYGARATPFERDGGFWFELPAYGGRPARAARVALCVGSHRYQQYFELAGGEPGDAYERLPLVWHVGEQRWMHLNGAFLEPDSPDWADHTGTWNENCVFCHNTAPQPRIELAKDGDVARSKHFATRVAELGIACEACHGPGERHAQVQASPLARYAAHLGGGGDASIASPAKLGQFESLALCGQCHSQRLPDPPEKLWTYLASGPTFRPGETLAGHVRPVTRDTPSVDPRNPQLFAQRFWADGTARLSAYEYLGVTQSPCMKSGALTCLSCHAMHGPDLAGQSAPGMDGDRACTQCHEKIANDVRGHTHHDPAGAGARCLECHMPRMDYGILAIHRSHRIESPDAKRDVELGRPHACTQCHLERTAEWSADKLREWYGERYERPRSRPDRAPLDVPEALASLHSGDALQRAVYAWHFGRPDAGLAPRAKGFAVAHLIVALGDAYASVRYLAWRSLLALDAELGLGLEGELRAFDHLAPQDRRVARIRGLLADFAARAPSRCDPPAEGTLLARDFALDVERVRALLDLQTDHVVSIGE